MRVGEDATRERALRFVNFLTAAVTPFHAVSEGSRMLEAAGYVGLEESTAWAGLIEPGGKYYYTRCDSTLVAFAVGGRYAAGGPIKVVGAHTDSPALKTKPLTRFGSGATEGLTQLAVVTYGGGLWHTWFDRDLGIGGLVLLRKPDGSLQKRLVAIRAPVLRIPSLCIHLQTAAEREAFAPNKETHLVPILCAPAPEPAASAAAGGGGGGAAGCSAAEPADPFAAAQEPELLALLAAELGVPPSEIASMDLTLFDAQPPQLTGARREFVSGGRLDNLASTFVALEALIDGSAPELLSAEEGVNCVALFDHEEVGSASAAGAGGPVMEEAMSRVGEALGVPPKSELALRCLRRSFLLSLDNAHAVHPNYRVGAGGRAPDPLAGPFSLSFWLGRLACAPLPAPRTPADPCPPARHLPNPRCAMNTKNEHTNRRSTRRATGRRWARAPSSRTTPTSARPAAAPARAPARAPLPLLTRRAPTASAGATRRTRSPPSWCASWARWRARRRRSSS